MKLFLRTIAPLLAIAVFHTERVVCQSPNSGLLAGIGTECINALQSLLTNGDLVECLQLSKPISAFGSLPAGASIIPVLDTYFTHDLCPAIACSPTALQSANATVTQMCAAELQGPHSFLPNIALMVLTEFVTLKQAFCLLDPKNNGQDCASQMLTTFQTSLGQNLSVAALARISKGNGSAVDAAEAGALSYGRASGPSTSAFCTDCTHGVLTKLLATTLPFQDNLQKFGDGIAEQCAFNLTVVPTSLTQSANLGSSAAMPAASMSATKTIANSSPKLSDPLLSSASSVVFALLTMLLTIVFASQAA